MNIHPIGTASIALFLSPADLEEHGLTPETLSTQRALELTRRACRQAGLALEGDVEIEAYPGGCGILVFAHASPPRRCWFSFDSLPALLSAARALPHPPEEAALFWWEDAWWLSLPGEQVHAVNILSEFGTPCRARPFFDARVEEYGMSVFPSRALHHLLACFPV